MMNTEKFRQRYGPWALVTGASDGIGRAFAREAARLGLHVVLAARRQDLLANLASELTVAHRVQTKVIACDLTTEDGMTALEESTRDLDIGLLAAAAGFGTSGPFLEAKLPEERSMLAVNCYALMRQCLTFGKRFAERGRGGMVLMASLVGWQGVPQSAHYAATKAYVQSLAEALYIELTPKGIDVLAAAPGPVRSGFARRADMRMGMAMQPEPVAVAALGALGRKATVIPGPLSKLLTYSLLPLPRWARVRILARVMANMTKHQTAGRRGPLANAFREHSNLMESDQ